MLGVALAATLLFFALPARVAAGVAAQQLASQSPETGATPPNDLSDRLSEDLAEDIEDALSLYRRDPDAADVERLIARWEEEGGAPTDEARLVVAALWRRAGETDRALAALGGVEPDGPLAGLAALEEARVLFAFGAPSDGDSGHAEDTDDFGAALNDVFASQAFWEACRAMDARLKAELWLDLRGLATPLEAAEWASFPGQPATCSWVRNLMAKRALGMAVSIDERLAIHYRRLFHVRDWYYLRQPRFTEDMADRLGRPDSLEFDDRGLVLLRMGPPDRRAGELNLAVQSNVSWAYYDRAGPRIYHFAPVSRVFAGGIQPLGDYRMLENLAYATGLTMTQELLRVGGGPFARLYMSRAGLDMGFAQLAFDYAMTGSELNGVRLRSPANFMRVLAQERERTRIDAEAVLQRVPDVPQVVPVVAYAQELLRFWDPDRSRVQVWALLSARARDLTRAVHPGGRIEYGVRATFGAVADGAYYLERAEARASAREVGPDDGIPMRVALELPTGRHPYTVLVQDQLQLLAGNWQRDTIVVPELPEGIPAVSDIAVATDSGGSWTRDGQTFLRVSPTHVVGPDGSVIVYFEVYNVEPGRRYQVETRVVPASVKLQVFSGKVADVAFTLRYRSEMPASKIGRELLRIDLSETPPGAYLLGVRVRDVESDIVSLPVITPLSR